MLVGEARAIAQAWADDEGRKLPGVYGAYLAGSINDAAAGDEHPATSDLDLMVVLNQPAPPQKPGKFPYRDLLLEVSYLSREQFQTTDQILGHYHLAPSFQASRLLLDPTGQLARLQQAVAASYPQRRWVDRRAEHVQANLLRFLDSLDETAPVHDQVSSWLFGTGVTTHLLLVAGLKNPTVRKRYLAARDVLAEYDRLDFYAELLELLGCARMSRRQAERHLDTLAVVFDAASAVGRTPFFYSSDISVAARPIAIDGSRELIERGDHREAVFWIVATYARCQKILAHDTPAVLRDAYLPAFRDLLADLGIESFADLQARSAAVRAFLPRLWAVTEEIMAANPAVVD